MRAALFEKLGGGPACLGTVVGQSLTGQDDGLDLTLPYIVGDPAQPSLTLGRVWEGGIGHTLEVFFGLISIDDPAGVAIVVLDRVPNPWGAVTDKDEFGYPVGVGRAAGAHMNWPNSLATAMSQK
jgi:hypothetical protein